MVTVALGLASLTACSTLEGVNVGASIPIGGIGGIGVNKTIGNGSSSPRGQSSLGSRQESTKDIKAEEAEFDNETDAQFQMTTTI